MSDWSYALVVSDQTSPNPYAVKVVALGTFADMERQRVPGAGAVLRVKNGTYIGEVILMPPGAHAELFTTGRII